MKLYMSGALMGSHDLSKSRKLYEEFAAVCSKVDCSLYLPHQKTDPQKTQNVTNRTVADVDIMQLLSSDAVLAYLGEPSLGVGAELMISIFHHKPILALFEETNPVSRFMLGLLESYSRAYLCSYKTLESGFKWLEDTLEANSILTEKPQDQITNQNLIDVITRSRNVNLEING